MVNWRSGTSLNIISFEVFLNDVTNKPSRTYWLSRTDVILTQFLEKKLKNSWYSWRDHKFFLIFKWQYGCHKYTKSTKIKTKESRFLEWKKKKQLGSKIIQFYRVNNVLRKKI